MKKNQLESRIDNLKINEALLAENGSVLDVNGLMKVEGGADNDEDWCIVGQCKDNAQKNCYTGA